MKQYSISHLSYDYLAMNKQLVTYAARYIFLQEIWRDGRRYIIATLKVFGQDKEEIVRVVIKYD